MKKGSNNTFILDSFALLAFLRREKGGEIVKSLFEKAQSKNVKILLPLINYGEVIYILIRNTGKDRIGYLESHIENLPIKITALDLELTKEAAYIKAGGGISYADSFVVATAMKYDGTIVTGDPEFRQFRNRVKIEWL